MVWQCEMAGNRLCVIMCEWMEENQGKGVGEKEEKEKNEKELEKKRK